MGGKIVYQDISEFPEMAVSCHDMTYNKTGTWRVQLPEIHLENCIRCLICWKYCPDTAIEIHDGEPRINYDFCKGCGICSEECPKNCISLSQEKK